MVFTVYVYTVGRSVEKYQFLSVCVEEGERARLGKCEATFHLADGWYKFLNIKIESSGPLCDRRVLDILCPTRSVSLKHTNTSGLVENGADSAHTFERRQQ